LKVVVTSESRFVQTPDGRVWTQGPAQYSFWQRYLGTFEHVEILARVRFLEQSPDKFHPVDGPGVSVISLPYYVGLAQYLRRRFALSKRIAEALQDEAAVIMRAPGRIATAALENMPEGRPFGVEVVGDPYDTTSPGAMNHPLRALIRSAVTRDLKRMVKKASAVSYVTAHRLQSRYPAASDAFTTSYSSIELLEEHFAEGEQVRMRHEPIRCITVGTLAQMYKGTDILIRAIDALRHKGLPVHLRIVGDGQYRPELEKLCRDLGVDHLVEFVGQVPSGDAVRTLLDSSDLFVLPSRQEGLPRAMIEAMARGLPAIGTRVGGIPELLEPEDLVDANDVEGLASKIAEVMQDSERMIAMSRRNLATARNYEAAILNERRNAFYSYLLRLTEERVQRAI
jgi:glycosyltransferase involved in cell wall biosynthesis